MAAGSGFPARILPVTKGQQRARLPEHDGTDHAEKCLHREEVGVAHGELSQYPKGILQVPPRLLIFLCWDEIAHHPKPVSDGERDVEAGPPARTSEGGL